MYCILKILNNNALLAKEKDSGSERILLGKGIGFGKKAGDRIDPRRNPGVYTGGKRRKQFGYKYGKYHRSCLY